jgi:hypothetical protein
MEVLNMNQDIKNKILEVLEENYSVSLWSADNRLAIAKKIAVNLGEKNDDRTSKVSEVNKPKVVPDLTSQSITNPTEEINPMDAMAGKDIKILNSRISNPVIETEVEVEKVETKKTKSKKKNKKVVEKKEKVVSEKSEEKNSHSISEEDKSKFFNKPKKPKRRSGIFSKKTKRVK